MARKTSKRAKGKKGRGTASPGPFLTVDTFLDLVGLGFVALGAITALAMLPSQRPPLVMPWLRLLAELFGFAALAAPVIFLAFGFWLIVRRFVVAASVPWYRFGGFLLLGAAFLGFEGMLHEWRAPGADGGYGGLVGTAIFEGLRAGFGPAAVPVALLFAALIALLLIFELSLADVGRFVGRVRARLFPPEADPEQHTFRFDADGARIASKAPRQLVLPGVPRLWEQTRSWLTRVQEGLARVRPTPVPASPEPFPKGAATAPESNVSETIALDSSDTPWELPPWRSLLADVPERESDWDDIRRKAKLIEETLGHFGVPAQVIEVNRGPTVTQYGVEPGFRRRRVRGVERDVKVKVSAITNLHNDLALALAAPRIRIEAPVPGQHYVGIEVPNDRSSSVTLRGTMDSEPFQTMNAPLRIALGRDVMGHAVVADLGRMPHLLIAGATGSGKSVCINSLITCLLCNNTPDQLKLLMIDPKMVELIGYNGVPHLIVPVVTEIDRVVGLLRWTVNEMERRYKIFSQEAVRNLAAYNQKMRGNGEKTLPHLVLIIDELADLMMAAPDQVETMVCRLAQMARATGIHMILATQRPSVDVVTGLIKANFPARIAFAVSSAVDSRVILDSNGAESLLGQGDMLYQAPDASGLKRAQGCFVSDDELSAINTFWREQVEALKDPAKRRATQAAKQDRRKVEAVQPVLWDELLDDGEDEEDELMPKARELVAERGRASVSLIQRRLRVGHARAARIVDLLEEEGTIGRDVGPGKHREVFVDGNEDVDEADE